MSMFRRITFVVGCSLLSLSAHAACRVSYNDVRNNVTFPATLAVPNTATVGTVLFTNEITIPVIGSNLAVDCDTKVSRSLIGAYRNGWVGGSNGIAPTNVRGIGVRISMRNGSDTRQYIPFNYDIGSSGFMAPSNPFLFRIELIVTGPITPGSLSTGLYGGFQLSGDVWMESWVVTGAASKVVSVGCTVTKSSIPVPMGTVDQFDFKGVGTSTAAVPFTVPLDCIAGTRVNIQLDGTADASRATGVLALDASATNNVATGVGLQLLNGSTPVALATPTAVGTATSAGAFSVSLGARYYQTASRITAGQANATATFTMTYN